MFNMKNHVIQFLAEAGVMVNGSSSHDIIVNNEAFYGRVAREGSLGLGESYMDGWWDAKSLDQFFAKILDEKLRKRASLSWWGKTKSVLGIFKDMVFNPQSRRQAFVVGERHYDIGNDIYCSMLDKRLVYTCGYWADAATLDQAQEAKLNLVCRKIGLCEYDKVLDIGCGFGSFLKFAAQKYNVRGLGVTVSKEQVALGRDLCRSLPVEIVLQDYRDVNGKFDHVVSLGMFEHVGCLNYRTYMHKVHDVLKDDGLFLLHTIGTNQSVARGDPWLSKYIFPNGMLPSIAQIAKSIEGLFIMEDWHNFGTDYDRTLMAWHGRFNHAWPQLRQRYNERFRRMWNYYLLSCAAIFRTRNAQLWQIVLSKKGIREGYMSVR